MPKGKPITYRIRTLIAVAYNQHRGEKAEYVRQVASQMCGRELGLSTVQRELARLRKEHPKGSTDPIDNQWSLTSLREYPIETKDIPFLLYIQYTFDANVPDDVKQFAKKEGHNTPFLTNRMAIWISRFIRLVHTDPRATNYKEIWTPPKAATNKPGQWPDWVDDLVHIAMWYSNYEIGCELAGIKPINTINFDAPTLDLIKYNIAMYNQGVLESKGIKTGDEPDLAERLQSINAEDIVSKGGKRNARPHNKKG